MLNLGDRTVSFTMNGEYMTDALGSETAFRDIQIGDGEFIYLGFMFLLFSQNVK